MLNPFRLVKVNMDSDSDQDFEATLQDRDGWLGVRDLLLNWLPYAISREWRSTLRIHRSPQLRRILRRFLDEGPKVFFSYQLLLT